MNIRKFSIVLALVVVVGGFLLFRLLGARKEAPPTYETQRSLRSILVFEPKMQLLSIEIPFSGRLRATERVDLFAEVTGTFQGSSNNFKEGVRFRKGQLLFSVDSREERKNLLAARSAFLTSLTMMLADLKLDYPEEFETWKTYVDNFRIEKTLAPLPEIKNERLQYFLSSRDVFNPYYSIKSREDRLSKYQVYAPFNGVLTNVQAELGSLIRTGQPIARFISLDRFELEAAIEAESMPLFKVGDEAKVYFQSLADTLVAKVARVSPVLNPSTQTLTVFLSISHPNLYEGQYGEGVIRSSAKVNCFSVPRAVLIDKSTMAVVEDSLVKHQTIELITIQNDRALIKGLKAGQLSLTRQMPDLLVGTKVSPVLQDTLSEELPRTTSNND